MVKRCKGWREIGLLLLTADFQKRFDFSLITRGGTEVQVKEAVARKSGSKLRVEDIVDDGLVRELEKSGFIDRVYKQ